MPSAGTGGEGRRLLFVGTAASLGCLLGPTQLSGYETLTAHAYNDAQLAERTEALAASRPQLTVIVDPTRYAAQTLAKLPGWRLGLLTAPAATAERVGGAQACHLLVSLDPRLDRLGPLHVWRAIAPPVSPRFYAPRRRREGLALTVGRYSAYRESVLLEAKHRFDLLQILEGAQAEELADWFTRYPVAVYVPSDPAAGAGWQVAAHLAAGQLLLSEPQPTMFGLEEGIDYLPFRGAKELIHLLDTVARFPEAFQAIAVRGRLKAQQFRAESVWQRLLADVLAWRQIAADPLSGAAL